MKWSGAGLKAEVVWSWSQSRNGLKLGFSVNWAGSASSPYFGYFFPFADCGSATCRTGATSSFRNCPYMFRNVFGWAVQELIVKMKFFEHLIHEFNLGPVLAHFEAPYGVSGMKIQKCSSEVFSLRNQNFCRFKQF